MAEYIGIEAVRKDAALLGELIRNSRKGEGTLRSTTMIGMLTTKLFTQMIKSDASAWVFDQIIAYAAVPDSSSTITEDEQDVHGLFGIGHSQDSMGA